MFNGVEIPKGLVSAKVASSYLGVCESTLRNWHATGKIKAVRTSATGRRMYDLRSFLAEREETKHFVPDRQRRKIIYARVSSRAQKDDLERQIAFLSARFPDHELISEIAGGLNWKRKKFRALVESAIKGDVEEIVVTYKDRLARFGFDLIEWLVQTYSQGRIVVLRQQDLSPSQEMVSDLIAIVTSFSARIHGLRRYKAEFAQFKNKEDTVSTQPAIKSEIEFLASNDPLLSKASH